MNFFLDFAITVVVIALQIFLSSRKRISYRLILPILTAIYFLVSKRLVVYRYLCVELITLGIVVIIFQVIMANKWKGSNADRSKIIDL